MTATVETGDLPAVPTSEAPGPEDVTATAALGDALGPLLRLRALPPVRALRAQSLTGPGGVVLAVLVVCPGVLLDLVTDGTLGLPSTVGVVLAGVSAALAVRATALGTAAVLPPLLFAGAVLALAWLSGQNDGLRELALDAGTTLALSAPALFTASVIPVTIVLGRLAWKVARR